MSRSKTIALVIWASLAINGSLHFVGKAIAGDPTSGGGGDAQALLGPDVAGAVITDSTGPVQLGTACTSGATGDVCTGGDFGFEGDAHLGATLYLTATATGSVARITSPSDTRVCIGGGSTQCAFEVSGNDIQTGTATSISVGNFLILKDYAGVPTATDCDVAGEEGRIVSNGADIYVCDQTGGTTGWQLVYDGST